MLLSLMSAPAGEHRWGANYVRQQISRWEHFRQGNAPAATWSCRAGRIVFGTMAAGSFVSGQVLILHGWAAVNWIVFPPVAVALLVLLSSGLLRARAVPAA